MEKKTTQQKTNLQTVAQWILLPQPKFALRPAICHLYFVSGPPGRTWKHSFVPHRWKLCHCGLEIWVLFKVHRWMWHCYWKMRSPQMCQQTQWVKVQGAS